MSQTHEITERDLPCENEHCKRLELMVIAAQHEADDIERDYETLLRRRKMNMLAHLSPHQRRLLNRSEMVELLTLMDEVHLNDNWRLDLRQQIKAVANAKGSLPTREALITLAAVCMNIAAAIPTNTHAGPRDTRRRR